MDFVFMTPEETINFDQQDASSRGADGYGTFGPKEDAKNSNDDDNDSSSFPKVTTSTVTPTNGNQQKGAAQEAAETAPLLLQHQSPPPGDEEEERFVLTIIAPDMVSLPPHMVHEEWEPFTARRDPATMVSVHLHLLLVSMLNRFIRLQTIPKEAIHFQADETTGVSTVQMLLPGSLLSQVVAHCERLGVGNMVGMVYATRVQVSAIPDAKLLSDTSAAAPPPTSRLIVAQPHVVQRISLAQRMFRSSAAASSTRSHSRQSSFSSQDEEGGSPSITHSPIPLSTSGEDAAVTAARAAAAAAIAASSKPLPLMVQEEEDVGAGATSNDRSKNRGATKIGFRSTVSLDSAGDNEDGNDDNEADEEMGGKAANATHDDSDDDDDLFFQWVDAVLEARHAWLFLASCTRVEFVLQRVAAAAGVSRDLSFAVMCAATVVAVGTATDSRLAMFLGTFLSASHIVGPVVGFAVGTAVNRPSLALWSLSSQLFALLICVVVGFVCGMLASHWQVLFNLVDMPSKEMMYQPDELFVQVLVTVPAGIASVLSKPNGSGGGSGVALGVIFSVALLPPAVKSGLWLAHATTGQELDHQEEFALTGARSLAVSVVNLLAIWLAGTFTLWLKRMCPTRRGPDVFWSRDVSVAQRRGVHVQQATQQAQPSKNAVLGTTTTTDATKSISSCVETVNLGLKAALDLKLLIHPVPMSPVALGDFNTITVGGQSSESHYIRSDQWGSRFNELDRARDVLFDDTILFTGDRQPRYHQEIPKLPEDFAVDQRGFASRCLVHL